MGLFEVNDDIGLYAGFQLYPISEGDIEVGSSDGDLERDDFVTIRLGGEFQLGRFGINPEFSFVGEQSFTLRATFPL